MANEVEDNIEKHLRQVQIQTLQSVCVKYVKLSDLFLPYSIVNIASNQIKFSR